MVSLASAGAFFQFLCIEAGGFKVPELGLRDVEGVRVQVQGSRINVNSFGGLAPCFLCPRFFRFPEVGLYYLAPSRSIRSVGRVRSVGRPCQKTLFPQWFRLYATCAAYMNEHQIVFG